MGRVPALLGMLVERRLHEIDGIAARKCSVQISPSLEKLMWPGRQYAWFGRGGESFEGGDPDFAISRFAGNYQVWYQRPTKGRQEERSGTFLIGEEMPEKSLAYGKARSVCKRAWTCDNGT